MNEYSNVFSNSTAHAIKVYTKAKHIIIWAGTEAWAVYGRCNTIQGIQVKLLAAMNPDDQAAIADTAFQLKRSHFQTADPNKREENFILRLQGENFQSVAA